MNIVNCTDTIGPVQEYFCTGPTGVSKSDHAVGHYITSNKVVRG